MKISRGVQQKPFSIFIYGEAGSGKSTLASKTPKPIFFDLDRNGTSFLNVDRALDDKEKPISTWGDILTGMDWLIKNKDKHDYETVVVDTLDAAEHLCHKYLCEKDHVESIMDYGKGFGKGYDAALDEFRTLVTKFSGLRDVGMNVLVIGHRKVTTTKNPDGKDWERHEPKCHNRIVGFLLETMDAVLYLGEEVITETSKDGRRTKALDSKKILYTENSPTHVAKNRYCLKSEMALHWPDLAFNIRMTPDALMERIEKTVAGYQSRKKPMFEEEEAAAFLAKIKDKDNAGNAQRLQEALSWLHRKDD